MKATDFEEKVDKSFGLKMVISGLATMVEDEGYSPHEAFRMLEDVKRNTFHALLEIKREGEA